MNYRSFSPVLFLFLLLSCQKEKEQEVLVLPTIHGAHENNENYSYDDLIETIKAYNPEVIGVEIRPEDFQMQSDSLDVFYPLEMIMVRDSFPKITYGIDFYSEGTRDIVVHREMFADTVSEMYRFKKLSQDMSLDTNLVKKFEEAGISGIYKEQQNMAKSFSAEEFLKGKYDSITRLQYQLEDSLLNNSKYEAYTVFNNQRDLQITKNAIELIEQNPQKKVLILVGANHRGRLVDSLVNRKVKLINNLNFIKDN